ncbi:MAG: hypothetical protein QXL67_04430 [Candidatus Bathyarchaeia archaeon]
MRKLADFKVVLEEKIKRLEEEIEGLKVMRNVLDSLLIEKGFKRAVAVAPPIQPQKQQPEPQPPGERVNVIPIKTVEGIHLADMYFEEGNLRVTPSGDVLFRLDTPPFQPFLVGRVLEKMRLKDRESSMRGEIPPEEVLNYEVKSEDGVLREVLITNVTEERLQELKSAIRWTLEKMYEKSILREGEV